MKKLVLLTLVCVLTAGISNAQKINRDDFYIGARATGAELSFGSGTNFGIAAEGGYFLFDKFAFGGLFGLNYTSENGESNTSVILMAGGRYYFLEMGSGALFAGAYAGIEKLESDTSFAIDLRGGYSIFVADNVAIEPTVGVFIPFAKNHDATFGIGCGFTLFF